MPAFPLIPGVDNRHGDHNYNAALVYGWEDDMSEEWVCYIFGPITRAMRQDKHAIPALVVKGDRTYVFKGIGYRTVLYDNIGWWYLENGRLGTRERGMELAGQRFFRGGGS